MIRTYLIGPIYKVFFGVFSIFIILIISPILAVMIAYLLLVDVNYLEYLDPDFDWNEVDSEGDDENN
jgi:hypothetical protein